MKQIKQIYALRGIGVVLVIMFHWLFQSQMSIIQRGPVAIDIFFVLSGFFITNILLEGKEKAEQHSFPKVNVFKLFLLNRALRIFPIYYLTISLLYIFHDTTDTNIEHSFWYFFTYTSNFYFQKTQAWDGITSHLWSLAVEEQFYLFWPFVILIVNRRWLPYVISIFILIGLATQTFWAKSEYDILLPFTCFDALGIGALLSWITLYKVEYLKKVLWVLALLVGGCLLYFFAGKIINGQFPLAPEMFFSGIAALVIAYVFYTQNTNGTIKFSLVLNNPALIFLGKLCYGLYVYHNIIPHYLMRFVNQTNLLRYLPSVFTTHFDLWFFTLNFVVLLSVSWLSWKYIERPILSLKKRFVYKSSSLPKPKGFVAA